jgi:stress-induced-phosphoprotein 1
LFLQHLASSISPFSSISSLFPFFFFFSWQADELKELGNEAFKSHQFEVAEHYFSAAINFEPRNHLFYSNRSAAYAYQRKYDLALADANKTIAIQPDWPKGYGRKAAALEGSGDIAGAREAYKQGLKYDPDNQALHDGLHKLKEKEASS